MAKRKGWKRTTDAKPDSNVHVLGAWVVSGALNIERCYYSSYHWAWRLPPKSVSGKPRHVGRPHAWIELPEVD